MQRIARDAGRFLLFLLLLPSGAPGGEFVAGFDELPLPGPDTYWDGSDGAGGFFSAGVFLENRFDSAFKAWSGFAYSNVNRPGTGGWENQFAAYSPGTDRGGDGIYALGYYVEQSAWSQEYRPRITLASPAVVLDLWVNNTAYTAWDIRDGGGFGDPFGPGDWFRLRIAGLDDALQPVGQEVEVYLADFRGGLRFLMADWTRVDLAPFGGPVRHLEFRLDGSKVGDWGLDTPAYFALDDLRIVPEPGAAVLFLAGLSCLAARRRRRA